MKTLKTLLLAAFAVSAIGCTTIQVGTETTRNVQRTPPSTTPGVTPMSVSDGAPAVVFVRSNTSITVFGSSDVDEIAPAVK